MIIQPERGTRNINEKFYEMETRQIAMLNEIFGEVDLTKREMRTFLWNGAQFLRNMQCG